MLTLHFWSQELITLATQFKCSLMHQIRTSSWKLTKRAGGGKGGWETGQRSFVRQYHTPVSCEVWVHRPGYLHPPPCLGGWGGVGTVHAVCLMSVFLLPSRVPWVLVCMLDVLTAREGIFPDNEEDIFYKGIYSLTPDS